LALRERCLRTSRHRDQQGRGHSGQTDDLQHVVSGQKVVSVRKFGAASGIHGEFESPSFTITRGQTCC
jgi:hypothetical protein